VFAVAAWVVLFSPLLAVRAVEVTGTERLPVGNVAAVAEHARGVPLVRVDTGKIVEELQALPVVRSAQVERSFPGTLRVTVTERRALAVVPGADGAFYLVDGEGVVLETVADAPAGVPVVQVDVASAGARTVREAVEVLGALPADLRAQVTTVSATTRDSVTLTLATEATVFWGSADDSQRKAQVLAVLLKTPASEYDVSSPDTPVTR
jgi:cell division protein FtsQ